MWPFKKQQPEPLPKNDDPPKSGAGFFSTDVPLFMPEIDRAALMARSLQKPMPRTRKGVGMDAAIGKWGGTDASVPDAQLGWYASQGFIGYQLCAVIAQHWLVDKACTMPARDAVRNGYEITVNDGSEAKPEIIAAMQKLDKRFSLNRNMREFVRMGRIFGIRHALFLVDSDDPNYYAKLFNIDSVKPGSYRGISQIDPYWLTPELDRNATANPANLHFYEPTWWRVNGLGRVHRSHFCIFRANEVPDVLKPTYNYGGVSIPQKIFERVYAAERTANEGPQLAMTKRSTVLSVNTAAALADQAAFEERMALWMYYLNNYGVKIIDRNDTYQQTDTALADVDTVTMTQYQLVAGASGVPVTKLMGTSPKGFQSSGSYEESSYHEELEAIQENDLTPLAERHHQLLMRSVIAPRFGISPVETEITWSPVASLTATEQADINVKKAQTDTALAQVGAIDGVDVRNRIIKDPDSGYSGIEPYEDDNGEENQSGEEAGAMGAPVQTPDNPGRTA
ncbi:DUF1073 domain-containing protein [Escherichia coli]